LDNKVFDITDARCNYEDIDSAFHVKLCSEILFQPNI